MNFFKKNGFTLVELMVAISIYIIMSVLLLASQDKFNSGISFSNLGYDIALTMRQAQTYGYAVRATSGGTFANAYGLHFAANNSNSFALFYEPILTAGGASTGVLPATNQPYPYTNNLQTVSTYALQNGYQISRLCYAAINDCGKNVTTPQGCTSMSPGNSLDTDYLDIVFQRPNTTAFMFSSAQNGTLLTEGAIELTSPVGEKECISVFQSGDIEVSPISAAVPS